MGHPKRKPAVESCDRYAEALEAMKPDSEPRLVIYEGKGTAGIGDRIKGILNLAALASAVSASVSVPPPCALLATSHVCRVQRQAVVVPSGCASNGTAAPVSLPCSWGWERYMQLRPPALTARTDAHAHSAPAHRVGPTLSVDAGARADLERAQRPGGLAWRVAPATAALLADEGGVRHCRPAPLAGAPVRELATRFAAKHGLSGRPYFAFHIRREGCPASVRDVEAVGAQLLNASAVPTPALLLFTDEPASPFFVEARAALARQFEVLRLDDELGAWQRAADGGVEDNYLVYLAELRLAAAAVANGHIYRCKAGAEACHSCRVDVNPHPGGARGWTFADA